MTGDMHTQAVTVLTAHVTKQALERERQVGLDYQVSQIMSDLQDQQRPGFNLSSS